MDTTMHPYRLSIVAAAGLLACILGCNSDEAGPAADAPPRVGIDVWKARSGTTERLTMLLQPREAAAEVSLPMLTDEAKHVADKLKQTAQRDPQMFLLMVRDGSSDGVPTYDARFGISREEYDDLMSGTHLRLKKTADAVVRIVSGAEGQFIIQGLPNLTEVKIDVPLLHVSTPYGDVARPEELVTTPMMELTGPLVGYRWVEPPMADDLRRFRIQEITLAQSQTDGAAWFIAHIADALDNRMVVDYYVRFAGPNE